MNVVQELQSADSAADPGAGEAEAQCRKTFPQARLPHSYQPVSYFVLISVIVLIPPLFLARLFFRKLGNCRVSILFFWIPNANVVDPFIVLPDPRIGNPKLRIRIREGPIDSGSGCLPGRFVAI
jgi:hypothetical protein